MKRPKIIGWHEPTETQAFDALNADALKGLSTQESKNRQARFGANRLTPKKDKHLLLLFLSQFHDPLIYILLVSALITPPRQNSCRLLPLRGNFILRNSKQLNSLDSTIAIRCHS